ncbi:MAG: UDP-N-acetylmuramate--L-alanine ligase [Bacteroidetes bacterium]|nr:UDP-N-acetylmuramate--L-alanine ligase [Bacteroidota bacterium]
MLNEQYRTVYFLGIGGIGMSGLARYFHRNGAAVSGYDKTPTTLTNQLIVEGVPVHFEDRPDLVPDKPDLVVYTPALPKDHKELRFAIEKGYPLKKRSEVLGMITRNTKTIAVAGTHGKTTITTMIAHILKTAGMNMVGFLGGISKNYNSNLIISGSPEKQSVSLPEYFVVEADEFDRSFLRLYPDTAVITSTDADHLDIYGDLAELRSSFEEFTSHIKDNGSLILKKNLQIKPSGSDRYSVRTYGLGEEADFCVENVRLENGRFVFDLVTPKKVISNLKLGLPGKFNLENAIAASAVAILLDIPADILARSLESFAGVQRRFDFQVLRDDFVYIDDYAHHPEELKACILAVREIYPGKKITGIFQPHLFTRTRDFADEFAASLELLDELILLDIYPARENPIEGITSEMLLDKVRMKEKMICTKTGLLQVLSAKKTEVLLTLGAGDIDQLVEPIRNLFMNAR